MPQYFLFQGFAGWENNGFDVDEKTVITRRFFCEIQVNGLLARRTRKGDFFTHGQTFVRDHKSFMTARTGYPHKHPLVDYKAL
jgi:hypothetical protein